MSILDWIGFGFIILGNRLGPVSFWYYTRTIFVIIRKFGVRFGNNPKYFKGSILPSYE